MCLISFKTRKAGFTLIELLVVIAIIALLVSILLPSLNKARDLAKSVVCTTGLKSLGTAVMFYADEYNGFFPRSYAKENNDGSIRWRHKLIPYLDLPVNPGQKRDIFYCPSNEGSFASYYVFSNYAVNRNVMCGNYTPTAPLGNMKDFDAASTTAVIADGKTSAMSSLAGDVFWYEFDPVSVPLSVTPENTLCFISYLHVGDRCNTVFLDNHVSPAISETDFGVSE